MRFTALEILKNAGYKEEDLKDQPIIIAGINIKTLEHLVNLESGETKISVGGKVHTVDIKADEVISKDAKTVIENKRPRIEDEVKNTSL